MLKLVYHSTSFFQLPGISFNCWCHNSRFLYLCFDYLFIYLFAASDEIQYQKPQRLRSRPYKVSGHKSLSRSQSCDSQSKGSVSSSQGTTVWPLLSISFQCENTIQRHISCTPGTVAHHRWFWFWFRFTACGARMAEVLVDVACWYSFLNVYQFLFLRYFSLYPFPCWITLVATRITKNCFVVITRLLLSLGLTFWSCRCRELT